MFLYYRLFTQVLNNKETGRLLHFRHCLSSPITTTKYITKLLLGLTSKAGVWLVI